MTPDDIIGAIASWAATRNDILAVALVGSYARGESTPDSDIDLVIIASDTAAYLSDTTWVDELGRARSVALEDWGALTSVRVQYQQGLEVEFGVAAATWCALPVDAGTREVVRDGCVALVDPHGRIAALVEACSSGMH